MARQYTKIGPSTLPMDSHRVPDCSVILSRMRQLKKDRASSLRKFRTYTVNNWTSCVWFYDIMRGKESPKFLDKHASLALAFPDLYSVAERDYIFLEWMHTEAALAVKRGLVSEGAAREIMGRDTWAALRFCPGKIPEECRSRYTAEHPKLSRNYAVPIWNDVETVFEVIEFCGKYAVSHGDLRTEWMENKQAIDLRECLEKKHSLVFYRSWYKREKPNCPDAITDLTMST